MSDYLTRNQVAELFQLPIRTIDYLVQTGQIPFVRIGQRGVRFSRGRLEEWTKERESIEYRLNK